MIQALLEGTAVTLPGKEAALDEVPMPPDLDRLYEDQLLTMKFEAARRHGYDRYRRSGRALEFRRAIRP